MCCTNDGVPLAPAGAFGQPDRPFRPLACGDSNAEMDGILCGPWLGSLVGGQRRGMAVSSGRALFGTGFQASHQLSSETCKF